MAIKNIVIIGAGGFAREVKWLIEEINKKKMQYKFLGFVVSDLTKLGTNDSTGEVLGDFNWLEQNKNKIDALTIGIGTPLVRAGIGDKLEKSLPELEWPNLIHPSVLMDYGSVQYGRGIILCANVVGTVNLEFADFCMVNLSCTVGHEARLGKGCVSNPTVNISGGVIIEDEVLIGTGAQVLQYIRIGKGASIGAGAVVTRDVQPGETVVGIPAKPLIRKIK